MTFRSTALWTVSLLVAHDTIYQFGGRKRFLLWMESETVDQQAQVSNGTPTITAEQQVHCDTNPVRHRQLAFEQIAGLELDFAARFHACSPVFPVWS